MGRLEIKARSMYGIKEDKPSKSIYICPKCDKWMAHDADSIKLHEKMFCAKFQKAKAAKKRKPRKKTTTKKTTTKKTNTTNPKKSTKGKGRKKS
jgi:uncharacterized paraquat-inducible protein A